MTQSNRRPVERIELDSVSCLFGSTVALRAVTLRLARGALHLVMGANGSGKSTLLRVIGTALRPTSGHVRYWPHEDVASVRREIGWLSHEGLGYADLSGRDNVRLAAALYGAGEGAWEAACERFALGRFSTRPVRTNSRGQRQRVALARALVHRPSVLLLDEPTAGLDREGVRTLLGVLEEELSGETLVVLVSHEPEVFAHLRPRKVVLERGMVRPEA